MFEKIQDDDGKCFPDYVTGLVAVMGNYFLCVLQSEDDLFMRAALMGLEQKVGTTPMLENCWVLHYQEELLESHFSSFTVKTVNP